MTRIPLIGLTTVQAPTSEPVTIEEVKAFAVLEDGESDALVSRWISAARRLVERRTGRQLVQAQLRAYADAFGDELVIPSPPLISVDEVAYVDASGAWQVLSSAAYQVSEGLEPARIWPAAGATWPTPRAQRQAVRVTFTAGYGYANDVDDVLKEAILRIAATWCMNREEVIEGGAAALVTRAGVDALLLDYETEPVVEEVAEPKIMQQYNRLRRLGGKGERRAGGYWRP